MRKLIYLVFFIISWTFPCLVFPTDKEPAILYKSIRSNVFYEALRIFSQNSVFSQSANWIFECMVSGNLEKIDPYAIFMTEDEYRSYRLVQKPFYAGVGMDIEKNLKGQITCVPFVGGTAELAGIRSGDILTFVDDFSVDSKSTPVIAASIRGKPGTVVNLGIQNQHGTTTTFSIQREIQSINTVGLNRDNKFPLLTITRFSSSTAREMRTLLGILEGNSVVAINLCDNFGGDFYGAVDTAMLFLEKDDTIVRIKNRTEEKSYKSTIDSVYKGSKIILWQNNYTASAAEIFIGALVQNNVAVSVGYQSYGKGTRQDIFELSDGSALIITTAYLLSPNGFFFHNDGLEPTYPISLHSPDLSQYINMTEKILSTVAP